MTIQSGLARSWSNRRLVGDSVCGRCGCGRYSGSDQVLGINVCLHLPMYSCICPYTAAFGVSRCEFRPQTYPPALHSFGGWLLLDAFIYKLFFFFGFCLFFFFSVKKNASQRIAETYGDGNALCMMLYYVCMHSGLCLCTNSCAARSRLLLIDHNERQ